MGAPIGPPTPTNESEAVVCFRPMNASSFDSTVAAELPRLADIITRLTRGLSLADEPAGFITALEEGAPGDD